MKKAGCYCIDYGVESALSFVLEAIDKKAEQDEMVSAFKLTKKMGIKTKMLLMVGNPGESEESVDETIGLIKETKPDYYTVSMTIVYPGTSLYEMAKSKGMLKDDHWITEFPVPIYTAERSRRTLDEWGDRINYAGSKGMEKLLRKLRSLLYRTTGIRMKEGCVEWWSGDVLKKRKVLRKTKRLD